MGFVSTGQKTRMIVCTTDVLVCLLVTLYNSANQAPGDGVAVLDNVSVLHLHVGPLYCVIQCHRPRVQVAPMHLRAHRGAQELGADHVWIHLRVGLAEPHYSERDSAHRRAGGASHTDFLFGDGGHSF